MQSKNIFLAMLVLLMTLSACAPSAPQQIAGVPDNTSVGSAEIETLEVIVLPSFPIQVSVVAKGNLADACTTLGDVKQTRQGDIFKIEVTTLRPQDSVCTQTMSHFDKTISLDVEGLAAGTYRLEVNGVQETFTLTMDNS